MTLDVRDEDLRIAQECRLNPLWIEGCASGASALEIPVPGLSLRTGLEALYERVVEFPISPEHVASASFRLPFPDYCFDLVTLYGLRPSSSTLEEIHRVLRGNGALLLGVQNSWWYGRLRISDHPPGAGVWAGRRLASAVKGAGFRSVHQYFVDPSLASPKNVVPANFATLRVAETLFGMEGGREGLARLLGGLGLFGTLFPARVILARPR